MWRLVAGTIIVLSESLRCDYFEFLAFWKMQSTFLENSKIGKRSYKTTATAGRLFEIHFILWDEARLLENFLKSVDDSKWRYDQHGCPPRLPMSRVRWTMCFQPLRWFASSSVAFLVDAWSVPLELQAFGITQKFPRCLLFWGQPKSITALNAMDSLAYFFVFAWFSVALVKSQ